MARPRSDEQIVTIQIKLRLRAESDADLVKWFGQIPERLRAPAVKAALRSGGMQPAVSNVDDEEIEAAMAALLG